MTASEYLRDEKKRRLLIERLSHEIVLLRGRPMKRLHAVKIISMHYGCTESKASMIAMLLDRKGVLVRRRLDDTTPRAFFVELKSREFPKLIVRRSPKTMRRTNFRRGPDKGDAPVLEIGRVELKVYDKQDREIHVGTHTSEQSGKLVLPVDPRKWTGWDFLPLHDVDEPMYWAIVSAIWRELQKRRKRK